MKNVIKDIDIEVQVVHYLCGWQLQTNAPWLQVTHKAKLEFTSYSIEGILATTLLVLENHCMNIFPTCDNYGPSLVYNMLRIPP